MATSGSGDDPISRLRALADAGSSTTISGIQKALFLTFILPVVTFFDKFSELIAALFDMLIIPITSFIDGLGAFILAIVGGAADIVDAGSSAAARSFLTGIWSALGPLAYPAAIIAVLAGAFVLLQYLQEGETSDSIVGIFSGTDLPDFGPIQFGAAEEGESDE